MKYISRTIEPEILKSLNSKEYLSIVGPRQAGKTTLLKRLQEYLLDKPDIDSNQVIFITFQNPLELVSFEENPVSYIQSKIKMKDKKNYVFIDEYQYAKNGGRDLKLIYDTQSNLKIIITGSSSLELRQIASQMVGRIFQFYLGQLSYKEILSQKSAVALNTFASVRKELLNFINTDVTPNLSEISPIAKNELESIFKELATYGSYPAVFTSNTNELKEQRLLNLYNSYVEKDIISLLKIGKSENFLKLVQYMALNIGQLFNYSNIQSELGLTLQETTIYLNALEETYIVKKVTPYFTNKTNELKKSPLYYFTDTGLRNWTISNFQDIDLRTDKGHLVENVVLKKLTDIIRENQKFRKINFWRKKSGAEVDFVLERLGENPTLIPIEVKYKRFKKPELTKSFYSFLDEYKPSIGIVVTRDFFGFEVFKNTKVLFVPGFVL